MKPGKRPMPTYLRVLRGDTGKGKNPIPPDEPMPMLPPAPPPAPPYLERYGAEEWDRIVTELWSLRLITNFDIAPLAAYCRAFHTFRLCSEKVQALEAGDPAMKGLLFKTRSGSLAPSPLHVMLRHAIADMLRCANEFGFTPAARSRISAIESQRSEGKFDGLLSSGWRDDAS